MQTRLILSILLVSFSTTAWNISIAENADAGSAVPTRTQDFQQIVRGGRIFQQNCAVCHGKLAQGAPNWRQRNEEGKFPPPPLNGDGHTWHHPMNVLVQTVRNGTIALGGSMPALGDRLSEQDIRDVLAWVQAQWPDEIYAKWYLNNQRRQK
ncbi:MAG: cytochrome c [Thiohalophilus sp.]|jgi:mono/diheme cytochrome c family protein